MFNVAAHYYGVIKHKFWVLCYMSEICVKLLYRAIIHDLSKFSKYECKLFAKYTPMLKKTTFGSKEYNEYLKLLGDALIHHYKHNPHHPQHYLNGINDMNILDFVEMYCDWKSSVRRHEDGNITTSIDVNAERFKMDKQLINILHNTN